MPRRTHRPSPRQRPAAPSRPVFRRRAPSPRPAVPAQFRDLAVDPRKSLGQHFLIDDDVLDRIVALADVGAADTVVEVGAGPGALTELLAATGARVLAVEIDEALCAYLRGRLGERGVRVACIDVLTLPPGELLDLAELEPPYVMVGNLPYYITALVVRHFLEAIVKPARMVIMVQREVAERMVASPPHLSLLGVSVQVYAEARMGFRVQPHAFYPPPKVDSAVIRLDVRRHPALPDNTDMFFKVVRAGFSQPRKQLHNALPASLWMPAGVAPALLRAAGIDPMRRAQSLSIEEWATLTEAYERAKGEWSAANA